MHSISHFKDHYIDPVIQHPAFQAACFVGVEVIKVIAVKIFLEYLGQRFLSHSTASKVKVYEATVLAPILEEIFFRLFVLQGIHLVQIVLNDFSKRPEEAKIEPCFRFQLYSKIFPPFTPQEQDEEAFKIPLHLPFMEELIYHGVQWGINWWQECRPSMRIHVISHVFRNAIPEEEGTFVIPVSPPVIEEILVRAYMTIVNSHLFDEFTDEEQQQQVLRIHLAAFIFAAAHLANDHSSKVGAITQFVWTYIAGIIYGRLSEKYHSLAPSMLIHGLNNSIATSAALYPEHYAPLIILALIVNKVGAYILGTIPIKAQEKEVLELEEDDLEIGVI